MDTLTPVQQIRLLRHFAASVPIQCKKISLAIILQVEIE